MILPECKSKVFKNASFSHGLMGSNGYNRVARLYFRRLIFVRLFMDKTIQTELEDATFKRFVSHLQQHTDVQNIDLMILADFCRNCLAKWYSAAALERGIELDYDQARELIYGMPYQEWRLNHQREATPEQLAAYEQKQKAKSESN